MGSLTSNYAFDTGGSSASYCVGVLLRAGQRERCAPRMKMRWALCTLSLLATCGSIVASSATADENISIDVPVRSEAAHTVNLSVTGAFEKLAHDSPAHYRAVEQLLAGIQQRAEADIPSWIQTTFDARDVEFAKPLLVTNPPKRQLGWPGCRPIG